MTSVSGKSSRGRPSAAQQDIDSTAKRISGLLDSIDMELLARAAFQCGAHARALLYFESYVRAKEQGTLNPVALSSTTYEDGDVFFFQASPVLYCSHQQTQILWPDIGSKSSHHMQHPVSPVKRAPPTQTEADRCTSKSDCLDSDSKCWLSGGVWQAGRARWAVWDGAATQWWPPPKGSGKRPPCAEFHAF